MAYATFNKPSLHFNTKLWTGNDTDNTSITGINFQPDLTWIKNRTSTNSHALFDAVRGATKYIESDTTDAEATGATFLKSFDSDGFTLGSGGRVNANSQNYVGWNWKANGQGSSNTDGTINTTYTSVNTAAGFSISTYTGNGTNGATIGHGLGVVPQSVWIKRLSNVDGLIAYHGSYGNNASVKMDRGDSSTGNFWNSTTPTSSVVTVTNSTENNTSGQTYVMYAFAEKKGYSNFGKYVGNGNDDGPFIYCGFKPGFVMLKNISAGSTPWFIFDVKRNPSNETDLKLNPSSNIAEASANPMDILSNGFKIRTSGSFTNDSGNTIIYWAFAAEPLVANVGASIPATAR